MALKGIEKTVKRFCVQTAVYWGNPVSNKKGGYTFDTPVELAPPNGVRWEDRSEIKRMPNGTIELSRASVLLLQDVDKFGYLYLGELSDFDSSVDTDDPINIEGAYLIIERDKIPMVRKTDEFVRTVWLYD